MIFRLIQRVVFNVFCSRKLETSDQRQPDQSQQLTTLRCSPTVSRMVDLMVPSPVRNGSNKCDNPMFHVISLVGMEYHLDWEYHLEMDFEKCDNPIETIDISLHHLFRLFKNQSEIGL